MKKFVSAAATFITLSHGERLTDKDMVDLCQLYVIWPVDDKWRIRYKWLKGWETIVANDFDTDNEAFSYAYQHFLANSASSGRVKD